MSLPKLKCDHEAKESVLVCIPCYDKWQEAFAIAVKALDKVIEDHQAGSTLSCCGLDMLAQEALRRISELGK